MTRVLRWPGLAVGGEGFPPRQPLAAQAPAARGHRRSVGFTLLEVLVIIVIIGVIVSAASISLGVLGRDREAEQETRRFWAVVRQAREEAELQGMDISMFISASAYEFLRFEPRLNEWVSMVEDSFYAPRELPEGLAFRLWLDAREVVLSPTLPDRADKQEHQKWPPQIMVLSNGDVMPFELHIERDSEEALWRVVALADNDLRVESRSADREWSVRAQTKPALDEVDKDANAQRVSAR